MTGVYLALQTPQTPRPPLTISDMIFGATLPTLIILSVLLLFSIIALWLIIWKARQFGRVRQEGDRFLEKMEVARGLDEAYQSILPLPESPYSRVFRSGVNFFSELRPGSLKEGSPVGPGLSVAQLEALRLVLEKEESQEVDELSWGMQWLAVIGNVSPLLGLMGTVIGVTNTFLGINNSGSTNIAAVAPGVAEALITTVAGLAVAIPTVIAYNHYVSRLNLVASELEGFSSEFIGTLAREGRV